MAESEEKLGRTAAASPTRSSLVKQIYPKPLLKLKPGPIKDELGFTLCERLALRQAWNLIRPQERRFGQDVFYTFLNEWYKGIYKFKKGTEINLGRLHVHALSFIRFVGALIEQRDPIMFQVMINENNQTHRGCKVEAEYIAILCHALVDYILKILDKVSSASLERGLQRIVDKFIAFKDIQTDSKKVCYNLSLEQMKTAP